MDLILLVGNVAIVCTIAANFAGLPVCLNILKRKSTSGVSSLPFLSGAVNTILWLHYGIVVSETVIILVNAISVFLQCSYLLIFYCSTENKSSVRQLVLPTTALLLSIHWYSFYYATRENAAQILGLFACSGNILASAAPLTRIREVFAYRSTRNLPFPIIFGTFIVSALWFTYGFLTNDTFIQVPNFIATTISGFLLSLFIIFGSKTEESKSE